MKNEKRKTAPHPCPLPRVQGRGGRAQRELSLEGRFVMAASQAVALLAVLVLVVGLGALGVR
jgi:hypothetical protein